jgi:hypothetical protein
LIGPIGTTFEAFVTVYFSGVGALIVRLFKWHETIAHTNLASIDGRGGRKQRSNFSGKNRLSALKRREIDVEGEPMTIAERAPAQIMAFESDPPVCEIQVSAGHRPSIK